METTKPRGGQPTAAATSCKGCTFQRNCINGSYCLRHRCYVERLPLPPCRE